MYCNLVGLHFATINLKFTQRKLKKGIIFIINFRWKNKLGEKQLTVDQIESKSLSKMYCTSKSNWINRKQQYILKVTVTKRGGGYSKKQQSERNLSRRVFSCLSNAASPSIVDEVAHFCLHHHDISCHLENDKSTKERVRVWAYTQKSSVETNALN